jgi:hypothetical protein
MKHKFTGEGELTLHIDGKIIPINHIEYPEIESMDEYEAVTVAGKNLHLVQRLHPLDTPSIPYAKSIMEFDCSIYDGNKLVVDMRNTYPTFGCYSRNEDRVTLLSEFWIFGECPLASKLSHLFKRNSEYIQTHRPDYSECYD